MALSLPRHRSDGALVDVRFSETRDMAAAKAFFRSAKTVTGVTPARVTTDGHDSYPRAIRTELGDGVKHRTNRYLNNRIEQDHRGVKGRYGPMRGFKSPDSASRFCRGFDELRNHLYPRSRRNQNIPTNSRRQRFLQRGIIRQQTCRPIENTYGMPTSTRRAGLHVRLSIGDRGQTVENQLQPLRKAVGVKSLRDDGYFVLVASELFKARSLVSGTSHIG